MENKIKRTYRIYYKGYTKKTWCVAPFNKEISNATYNTDKIVLEHHSSVINVPPCVVLLVHMLVERVVVEAASAAAVVVVVVEAYTRW